jgi:predicted metal-dependent enzyme (double-stranded beta helix superfamily)
MAYTLDEFCADCRMILKSAALGSALPQIAGRLEKLLANPAFIAETFNDDTPPGHRVLRHDPETDVHVLAHVQAAGKSGSPHSHGASWAVYGSARGHTDMTEWRRTNEGDEHAVLEAIDQYRLEQGQTRAYGPEVIHSTAHPEKAWVICVTGTDLDHIPRYRFSPKRDKILEKSAE